MIKGLEGKISNLGNFVRNNQEALIWYNPLFWLGVGIAREIYWRNTDEGKNWVEAVNCRGTELKIEEKSDYEIMSKLVSEFYGLR